MQKNEALEKFTEYLRKHSSVSYKHARVKAQDLGLDIESDEVSIAIVERGFSFVHGSSNLICRPETDETKSTV